MRHIPLRTSTIAVIVVGNVLEWYDFAAYGYFVGLIAKEFFPSQDRIAGLLAAFGVFALGFVGRVGGGIIYGIVSDRVGRGPALRLSVVLMATATTLIGFLPTYHAIGVLAPILLIILRLLQGLSVGGEFTTSMTMLAESATEGRRGFASGMVGGAAVLGFVLGSGVGALVSTILSEAQLESWGWRIPFLVGSVLGLTAWIMRRQLSGSSDPNVRVLQTRAILVSVFVTHGMGVFRTVLGIALYMVGFYVPFVYLATALQTKVNLPMNGALSIITVALILLGVITPLAGLLGDRIGITRLLIGAGVSLGIVSTPVFFWMEGGQVWKVILALVLMVILYAPINAVAGLPFVLQFPSAIRGTAFSVGFNIAAVLFGGLAPLVADFLVTHSGRIGYCGVLIFLAAILSVWAWSGVTPAKESPTYLSRVAISSD